MKPKTIAVIVVLISIFIIAGFFLAVKYHLLEVYTSAMLSLIALGVTVYEAQRNVQESRIRNLKDMRARQGKERALYVHESMKYEMDRRTPDILSDHYVITTGEWMLDDPILLEEVNVDLVKEKEYVRQDSIPKEIKGLPYPRLSYAKNLQRTTDVFLFSADTYGLADISRDGNSVSMKLYAGDYVDFINTCDLMSYEIVNAFNNPSESKTDSTKMDLPYRASIEPLKFTNRFAAIGVCTLTILINIKDSDKDYFLLHSRNGSTAEGAQSFHVVPAGSYQPLERYSIRDGKVTDPRTMDETVYKEFGEEILSLSNVGDIVTDGMIDIVKKGLDAKIFYIGIGLEPLNLKTEVLSFMIIDAGESELFKDKNSGVIASMFKGMEEGTVRMFPLEDEYISQFMNNDVSIPACREILKFISMKRAADKDYIGNLWRATACRT